MIKISLCGQNLMGEYSPAAADSIDYLEVLFSFSPDWYDLKKTAQFTQNGKTYNVLVERDRCFLPNEIKEGRADISVFGYEIGGTKRITSLPFSMMIRRSGFVPDGETPVPPTPDLYSQLISQVKYAVDAIPEKLSEFENDEGFVTGEEIPKKLSELENDAEYIRSNIEDASKMFRFDDEVFAVYSSGVVLGAKEAVVFQRGIDSALSIDEDGIRLVSEKGVKIYTVTDEKTSAVNKGYVDDLVGDIDTALDSILALENTLIGGDTQ